MNILIVRNGETVNNSELLRASLALMRTSDGYHVLKNQHGCDRTVVEKAEIGEFIETWLQLAEKTTR